MSPDNEPKTVSTSEKSHAKNVENLHVANTVVESLGGSYTPNNDLIMPPELITFESGIESRMQTVNEKETVEQNAVALQVAEFKKVKSRVRKIVKAAKEQSLAVYPFSFIIL